MRRARFPEIAAFLAVAELKSFAKASARLQVSPSALSQRLRDLEAALGVRLLHRTTRSVSTTDAGERLFARARPAFAEIDAAIDDMNRSGPVPTGLLRLVVQPPVADLWLAPLFRWFVTRYPT